MTRKNPEQLRSHRWFGESDMRGFGHHSRIGQMGYSRADYAGKPIIAIINTWSDINSCHMHFRERAEEVKRGVLQAGGFPLEMPALALAEVFQKPTTMLYRNLLAMETEELLRSYPVDGCVLMGGCDKTTPALLMGAISMNLPAIFLPAGPMLRGHWREKRAGNITEAQWREIEEGIARSPGHCMTMGTASTMTSATEAMGFTLPGAASIPAADSRHGRMAAETGRRIVDMVWEDQKPRDLLTAASIDNAVTTVLALGGSTNAVVHMVAVARRAGIPLTAERFDQLSQRTPLIANIRPAGKFLMEDFFYAGGLRALLAQISDLLSLNERTVNGRTVGDNIAGAEVFNSEVILPREKALVKSGSLAVLRGNLAPDGAVIKPAAAEARLWKHVGPAIVFADYNDMAARIDDPELPVTKDSVIVLKNAGPQGAPGMPEWGQLPIPKKLLAQGVRDMVRISDARMSGTSYGACVLHVAPESFVGGPLAFVQDGDLIELDVGARKLELKISDAELARRRAAWKSPAPKFARGFGALYQRHITQANQGCDFDFLEGTAPTPEPEIH